MHIISRELIATKKDLILVNWILVKKGMDEMMQFHTIHNTLFF